MINDPFNLAADFVKEWVSDKTYVEAYTSGSTGSPKLIRLKKIRHAYFCKGDM